MATTTVKGKLKQKLNNNDVLIMHPETEADVVKYNNTSSGLQATTVQDAINEIVTTGVGVTGVKGANETTYRSGNVNLTANQIFTDGSATIATESNSIVTIKKGVSQTSGTVGNSSGTDITLAKVAKTGNYSDLNNPATVSIVDGTTASEPSTNSVNVLNDLDANNHAITQNKIPVPTKHYVDAQIQDVREIAEGKNKAYVTTLVTGTQSGTTINGVYFGNTPISGTSTEVPTGSTLIAITPTSSSIDISKTSYSYMYLAGTYGGNHYTSVALNSIKQGDILYIVQTEYPDFWIETESSTYILHKLETSKVDLNNYVTNTQLSTELQNYVSDVSYNSSSHIISRTKNGASATVVDLDNFASISNGVVTIGGNTITPLTDDSGYQPVISDLSTIRSNAQTGAEHAAITSGNPHNVTKSNVGLGNVVNTGDSATPVSGGTTKFTTGGAYTELNKKADKVSMTAGTYSAVSVNSQGITTGGGQIIEVVNNGVTPSVITGGWYFEKDA